MNHTVSATPKLSLGIIGGGQLAQMLAENNPFHDLHIIVYSENKNCPAHASSAEIFVGQLNDKLRLQEFFKKINILTIENEFVDAELLRDMQETFKKVLFFPTIPSLQITQNKLFQKRLFEGLELPTAKFLAFEPGLDQPNSWLKKAYQQFPRGFMLKKAFGGYDGHGNFKVDNSNSLDQAEAFILNTLKNNSTVYAEELVSFSQELAKIYVSGIKGELISYPLVISEQEKNVCRLVYGPAIDFDLPQKLEEEALHIGEEIAQTLKFVGIFAIEFFLTQDGKLLINEMAPRVHNSGHYTLDASPQNQFENHIRAILGAPLKPPATYPFFAMRNMLGPQGAEKKLDPNVIEKFEKTEDVRPYWYAKEQLKPLRKMGHINTISLTKDDIIKKIKLMESLEKKFWESLK